MLYCKEAKAHEYVAPSAAIEYHRKVRIVSSALFTLTLVPSLLSLKNLLTAYCLISHKILRWFTPLFLIIFALLCIFFSTVPTGLSQETTKTFQILSVLQGIIIALGGIGYALTKQQKSLPIITQITYFISSNIALLHGIIRFLRADDAPFWASTKRS
jgi:cellulose synthase/poly-beta-1,6-N-acetylglucosamine synthase-like glycosyltransferase